MSPAITEDHVATQAHGQLGADSSLPEAQGQGTAQPIQLWRSDMGVEPTQDESIAPQTVLKTAVVTGPRAAPLTAIFARRLPPFTHASLKQTTVADDTGGGSPATGAHG